MIVVDVVLIVLLVASALVGFRRGLLASVGLFAGIALGAVAAYWVMPLVSSWIPEAIWRAPAVVGVGILLLFVGAAVGSGIGRAMRRGVDRIKLRVPERLLGGLVSFAAAALAVSFLGGALVSTGTPIISSALASSTVLRTIDGVTPPPVRATLAELRGSVFGDGLPTLGQLLEPAFVPTAPAVALDDPALTAAAQSVAKITGVAYACGITASGTGFAVAPDRVVTNAHVVAGVAQPVVELPGRPAREGRIVYFDPIDDLAVIAVDDLDAAPLTVVPTLAVGAAAVVQGYPHGGPFTSGTAQVVSVGSPNVPDIYDSSSAARDIYALAAVVRPGNSGGPLLTPSGEVAGVVFARSDSDDDVGYAMTPVELAPVIARLGELDSAVASGDCTA
ncbi:MarP family serine protease [Microbacterium sp. P06]|uniref:MarP family serine protease n=1 Tax=unclassified Microbacterium TaxID=2609290 RepID=UPI003746E398